jgi:pSer/pThr/pTyr-binding forkhead associated (FHA) protein
MTRMKAAFRHIAGSKNGMVERFDLERIRAGRDPSNDLRFDPYIDRDCSGFHAEIFEEEGKTWIHDLGSTNGTVVNGEKTMKRALEAGDVVEFGRHGPKVRFFPGDIPEGEGAAEAPGEGKKGVGVNTVHAIVNEAVQKAKGGGTAVFIKNVVRRP